MLERQIARIATLLEPRTAANAAAEYAGIVGNTLGTSDGGGGGGGHSVRVGRRADRRYLPG